MKSYEDDSKFIGVINTLKKLNKIEAPQNFEEDLFVKISQTPNEEKISFIDRILTPARLVPTAGLAATIILLFFLTNIFVPVAEENPLLANPRVRDDVIATNTQNNTTTTENTAKQKNNDDVFATTETENKTLNEETNKTSIDNPNLGIRITGQPSPANYYNNGILTSVSPNGLIDKTGLDYKQIYLQRLQRAQIELLRKKMEEMQRNSR